MENCNICASLSVCDECFNGLYLSVTNNCVTKCPDGDYHNTKGQYLTTILSHSTYTCDNCFSYCNSCTESATCN